MSQAQVAPLGVSAHLPDLGEANFGMRPSEPRLGLSPNLEALLQFHPVHTC